MDNLKEEGKLSSKHKLYVLACLTFGLLGVAIFHHEFPGKTGDLSDTIFIAVLVVFFVQFFWRKK
ncbi:MAG: hypothetical protein ABI123_08930 [Ginsengibacter sp.]|jgi:hypothetical protein